MAATLYAEFSCSAQQLHNELRTRILAQGDWTELSASPPPQLTTFTSSYAAGVASFAISATATNAPGLSVGDVVILDRGLATEERIKIASRTSTTLLGSSNNTVYAHASGTTLHDGTMLLRSTADNGAQLVVDLGEDMSNSVLGVGVYRAHDGTTGTDKTTRYPRWKQASTQAAGEQVYVALSVGKGHLYFTLEGARAGETGSEGVSNVRSHFFLGELLPYFDADTPAVVLVAPYQGLTSTPSDPYCHVSRNRANTASWVTARLGTISFAAPPTGTAGVLMPVTLAQRAAADGNTYFFPFLVIETTDGLRGRLRHVLDAGYNAATVVGEPVYTPGQRFTVAGADYVTSACLKGASSQVYFNPFGVGVGANGTQSIILVPR